MPTEDTAITSSVRVAVHPVAARRILRLALGVSLSLLCSQVFKWDISFVAAVLTLVLLATPFPAPNLKQGVVFVLALLLPSVASMALIPFLLHARFFCLVVMTFELL